MNERTRALTGETGQRLKYHGAARAASDFAGALL